MDPIDGTFSDVAYLLAAGVMFVTLSTLGVGLWVWKKLDFD